MFDVGPHRFEFRLGDGSANPYLLQAAIIAAGLDGLEKQTEPGEPCFENMYAPTPEAMAAAAGMPVWLQVVGLGLGVSGAYGTHVHATIANATIPSDSLHFTRENDLIGGALTPKNGLVKVPENPGLGIELDMVAVEKYRIA